MSHTLDWPFFDDVHRQLANAATLWATENISSNERTDVDAACRALVKSLGAAGWLRYCVAAENVGAPARLDARAICLLRETLAYQDGLADFVFAMQGLGAGPISLHGNREQKSAYLPRVAKGEAIAAFALSEAEAGSDVAAMTTTAIRQGDVWLLNGEKTWVSNGGIADFYVVFARSEDVSGSRSLSAFIVDAGTPGLAIVERLEVLAPHPLARIRFENCRVPSARLIGTAGAGFKIAMTTLDVFRTSVAAASLGFARRAFAEALRHAQSRKISGSRLADFQMTQARLAEMATAIDASALLIYRAAWQCDRGEKTTREAAMAKLFATEQAQQVIDAAVQMFGGRGVQKGEIVEALYRNIRALRIYEGASEVQKLIIARDVLKNDASRENPSDPR